MFIVIVQDAVSGKSSHGIKGMTSATGGCRGGLSTAGSR